jgi:phage shock protein A
MSIFARLFKVGQAQAHNIVDKLEDPIKLTEQGIRDLKTDLQGAMQGLAEVKGIAIRLGKESEDAKRQSGEYERKAMLLLQRGNDGQLDAADAERLATQALTQRETASERAVALVKDAEHQNNMVTQLQAKVQQLKSTITTYENELVTLRARAKTAASTKKINQQLANVDSSGTIAMLERMKEKVEEDEALAQAYGEVGQVEVSADAEIDRALAGTQPAAAQDKLRELKARMGLGPGSN